MVAGLSLSIIVGLLVTTMGNVFMDSRPTQERMRVIEMVLSGILAIISMYIGAKIQKRRDNDD